MAVQLDRGIEKTSFQDPHTGRTVWQLTDSPQLESRHAYYDHCPWSHDGKYILFSSARTEDVNVPMRDGLSCETAGICIMDSASGAISTVLSPAPYFTHHGVYAVWHPTENCIVYRSSSGEIGGEIGFIDVGTGVTSRVAADIRDITNDGRWLVTAYNQPSKLHGKPGVCVMAADGSTSDFIATKPQLYELTPNRDQFSASEMTIGNTKWSPDGQHVLVTMWVKSKPLVHRSLYLVSRDGSSARWLSHFGGHHGWTPDGTHIIHRDWLTRDADGSKRDARLCLIDVTTGETRIVIDMDLGSHPVMHPNNNLIFDWNEEGVYAVNISEQRFEWLVRYRKPFDQSHAGTHPHSVLNRDGTKLIYNSAETGHSELYCVSIADLL